MDNKDNSNSNGETHLLKTKYENHKDGDEKVDFKYQSIGNHDISNSTAHLKKSVGFMQGVIILVGILIGSGTFISPSLVMSRTNDAGISLIIWMIGGFIALGGSLCFCELGCAVKETGGIYIYIYKAYGSIPAFLSCWTLSFIIFPSGLAVTALTFGIYAMKPFENYITIYAWYPKIVAGLCVLIVCFINCWSIEGTKRAQKVFTSSQVLAILFLVVIGAWKLLQGDTVNIKNAFDNSSKNFKDFGMLGAALYNCLWSYEGWFTISTITEEMKNLEKNLLLSTITGICFIIVSYILINIVLLTSLTVAEIGSSPAVAVLFVGKTLGRNYEFVISIFVALSCFGAINGCFFTVSRVALAAGRQGHLPDILSMIHREKKTPIPSIILLTVLTLIMLLPKSSTLESLIQIFSFTIWLNYSFAISALIILRYKSPELPRPYKVWLSTAVIMTLTSLTMVVLPFFFDPVKPIIALIIVLLGLLLYYIFIYHGPRHPKRVVEMKRSLTMWVRNFLNLAPSIYQ